MSVEYRIIYFFVLVFYALCNQFFRLTGFHYIIKSSETKGFNRSWLEINNILTEDLIGPLRFWNDQ